MPLHIEFLVPRKPVSHQSSNKPNLAAWRDFVAASARQAWTIGPLSNMRLKFTMVYLADDANPGDINNFVKPVQDALNAVVYEDDAMIRDVSAHMRVLSEPITLADLPSGLAAAVAEGLPCVYVAISDSLELAEELK
jgi:Holliday junction resolvase RusA-like endonuclease